MSFTRLAGARSSSGFLAKSVRPSGSSSKTASAESDSGRPSATDRPGWAVAARGAKAATSTARAASVRPRCTGTDSSERSKRPASKNRSADGLLQLFRRFEARNASGDRHRLARARVLERAGLAPRHGKRSEADERDRGALVDHGREGATGALRRGARADLAEIPLERVGARVGHHRAHVLEWRRLGRAAAHLDAEALHHLRLEGVREHRDAEPALRAAE